MQSHLDDAADSADDPLGGRRWWLEAESPWQALAACCELTAALRSPDPSAHLCSLPVQLDGSCNGLQHYAALGRDEAGGRAVNLIPTEVSPSDPESAKPQDVYSKVRRPFIPLGALGISDAESFMGPLLLLLLRRRCWA